MLPFADSILVWTIVTISSAFIGLLAMVYVGGRFRPRFLAAFALGIFLWFFVDTIQGSSNLLVNEGYAGSAAQLASILLLALGAFLFFGADRKVQTPENQASGMFIPLLVAIAVGMHGLGEGVAFGSTSAQTTGSSLLEAFGGPGAGVAYSLHKFLEPMMAGAVYLAGPPSKSGKVRGLLAISLAFALPSVAGAAIGYYLAPEATYFFALGAGTSAYAALRLGRQAGAGAPAEGTDSLKLGAALVLGFILIYGAALLHS